MDPSTPVTAKLRAGAGPQISPSRAMPGHRRVQVDTTAIMAFVLKSIGQQDINGSVNGLRDSLALAVRKVAELADAIGDHASHLDTHYEGIAWAVRLVKTLNQNARA